MNEPADARSGASPGCGCVAAGFGRREFLRRSGLAAAGLALARWPVMAGPFTREEVAKLVPADKKLDPHWVESLFARGTRTVYRWPEAELIGMPVGGIGCGQLYLGGDGRLWHWDIFNQYLGTGDAHYAHPPKPSSPLQQGFALRVMRGGKAQTRPLDHTGWSEVSFIGEYPIGHVEYRDPGTPVTVALEAFSPFIPLNAEDSALPATVLRFSVRNTGAEPVEAQLTGWLENAVGLHSGASSAGLRRNRVVRRERFTFLECAAEPLPHPARTEPRSDIVFDDFEQAQYQGWTATGTAFGSGPVAADQMPEYQGKVGAHGKRLVNSHATAPGRSVEEKDAAIGTLTSRPFVIERDYVIFLIGGGAHAGKTCMNLLVDEKAVLSATGQNDNRLAPHSWDVRPWAGMQGRLQIVDNEKGGWGNIGIDDIVFTDTPRTPILPLTEQPDYGTLGIALLGSEIRNPKSETHPKPEARSQTKPATGVVRNSDFGPPSELGLRASDLSCPSLPDAGLPSAAFSFASDVPATKPFGEKLVGSLTRKFTLAPGAATTVAFVLTWHFPNLRLDGLGDTQGRHYGKRFADALAVADYIAGNFDRLASQTRMWHDTWYDSTLPYWFLDRTFLNTSILATSTCHWFGNGRFYGWEGVGCCAGTCGHVWHYAHAVARLFPSLERGLRERVDYGIGFDPATGRIRFRAEHNDHWAVDGQSGVILRTYREHQMSADDAFLRRVWPRAKQALGFLISKDAGADGLIDGPQHNTLDTDWFGHIAWLSGLYLAALRAGEEMARELGDEAFARQCREILEKGRKLMVDQLFDGEYFINQIDPQHLEAINSGTGCEIDQVFGQSWAWQVALGRVLPEKETRAALRSLWRYNFAPNVGPYREAHKPGRWYAMPGEAGLLMCTFPRADWDYAKASGKGPDWAAGYFDECMNGFEYQAGGHMLWEGMVLEGLAVTRAIHDRYHAARRNPWNEVECGDHYARSMASYGVFLAACGYEHHGPHGHLGFAPRLPAPDQARHGSRTPRSFRCAFTTAEGWGTFDQQPQISNLKSQIIVRWGRLRLRTLALGLQPDFRPTKVTVRLAQKTVAAALAIKEAKAEITLRDEVVVKEGEKLKVRLA